MMLRLTLLLSTLTFVLGCDPQNCINLKCHYEKAKPHCTYGCKPGYAGNICKEHCDHICFSCERYNFRRCTVCYNGHYGSRCEHQCTNCDNLRCYTNGSCCELSQLAGTCDTTCPTGCPDFSAESTSTYTPCTTIDSSSDQDPQENVHCKSNCIDHNETVCTRGCQPGYRGVLCDERCSEHCRGPCSQDTGHCLTGCKPNWFSSNCSKPCSKNCVNDVCDRESGECLHGCKDGFYGLDCSKACSGNCTEGKCDINGGCRCERGTRDESCYINCEDCVGGECGIDEDRQVTCPRGCKDLQTGSFCKELVPCNVRPECQSLSVGRRKKRDTENCHEEDEHGQCVCCKEGWRGLNCDIPCPPCHYSYRDDCSLACAGGFFGQECHLDCPANCSRATNGRSRCDVNGVCDSGCLQGHYGYVCEHTCPSTCLARTCFMNNGSCTEGCVYGRWGPRCENQCGRCVDMKCERDGSCTCEDEYYGPRCEYKCSDHCLSNVCIVDIDGNHLCEGECQPSYTGLDCLSPCPPRCSICDKESGICGDGSEETSNTYTSSTTVGPSDDQESPGPQLILGLSVGGFAAVAVAAVVVVVVVVVVAIVAVLKYRNTKSENLREKLVNKENTGGNDTTELNSKIISEEKNSQLKHVNNNQPSSITTQSSEKADNQRIGGEQGDSGV